MEAIDSTAKLSDRLGIQTEQLVGLSHAADLSNVSNEQLTGGLEKLLKNLSAATQGSKQQAQAFQALGLDAKQLINLPTDQAFGKIADSLNAIQNPAQKAALEMAIFGKQGQALSPLLATGSKGISDLVADANALGLSFSRVDAGKVEEANDALTRLKDVFIGLARQIGIAIAPAVASVADYFTSLGIKVIAVFKNILPPIVSGLGKLFDVVSAFISPVISFISNSLGTILGYLTGALATAYVAVSNVLSGVFSFVGTVFSGIVSIVSTAFEKVVAGVGVVLKAFGVSVPESMNGTASAVSIVGNLFSWLSDTVSNAMVVVSYSVKNWQLVFEIAGLTVIKNVVTLGNQIQYTFTEVIPALLTWFANNWRDIFTTLWNFTSTVFTNLAKNVANFFSALMSFLSGDGFNFEWTGLLDGFESTIKELPKIAERQVGPLEKALGDQLDQAKTDYATGLSDEFKRQKDIQQNIKTAVKTAIEVPEIKAPTIDIKSPKFEPLDMSGGSQKTKTPKATTEKDNAGTAIVVGSAEALSLRDMFFRAPKDERDKSFFADTSTGPSKATEDDDAVEDDTGDVIKDVADTYQPKISSLLEQMVTLLTKGNQKELAVNLKQVTI